MYGSVQRRCTAANSFGVRQGTAVYGVGVRSLVVGCTAVVGVRSVVVVQCTAVYGVGVSVSAPCGVRCRLRSV